MSEHDRLEESRRWLRYAQEDLLAAETMLGWKDMLPRHVFWLAHMLRNLVPHGWRLRTEHPDLAELTEWAVEARYPGDWPEAVEADARFAASQAQAIWDSVRVDLARCGVRLDEPE